MENQEHQPENDTSEPKNDSMAKVDTLLEVWSTLGHSDRVASFFRLNRTDAEELFLSLKASDQAEIIQEIYPNKRRSWVRLLAPDDAADIVQELPHEFRDEVLGLLDEQTRREVQALLAYSEDHAGGLMSSRFVRMRPDMRVDEAISYLRAQAKTHVETIYYAYVLDSEQCLLGVFSFRELFSAGPEKSVRDIMITDLVTIPEKMDQEQVSRIFSQYEFLAMPVVDEKNHMKGIVTVDDIVSVVEEEATEDIQKLGGVSALEEPYLKISFFTMIKKRAGWLLVLFLGEMFTATAMSFYEKEIEKAVVLALFIPLIISSGGNSGSQATTLIIRAMALGEVRERDWIRVMFREIFSGLTLGLILGAVGLARILLWPNKLEVYGPHFMRVGFAVSASLVGIVLWGTLVGSMLPFFFRKLKVDPATASAPFVATLVDVTGLVIYFTVASLVLRGVML